MLKTYAVLDQRNRVLKLRYSAVDARADNGQRMAELLEQSVDETPNAVRWAMLEDSNAVVGDEVERAFGRDLYRVKIRQA